MEEFPDKLAELHSFCCVIRWTKTLTAIWIRPLTDTNSIQELPYQDPADLFPAFAEYPFALFMDSAARDKRFGRYAYLCCDPFLRLQAENGIWQLKNRDDHVEEEGEGSPFPKLKALMAQYHQPTNPDLPPFQAGLAGLFSYDLGRSIEVLPEDTQDDMEMPDLAVGLYDTVLAFDILEQKCWLISTGFPETEDDARKKHAESRKHWFLTLIEEAEEARKALPSFIPKPRNWVMSDRPDAYRKKVASVIDYILAGDIFQANLSQRFETELEEGFNPVAFYSHLRSVNPAPFCAYLGIDERVVASSSPERFISLNGDLAESRPIKGTRPRGVDEAEDLALSNELLESEKDRAENVMIVDLLRNDLSRVCKAGSVDVPEICVLESYASVHHLVSTVTGNLDQGSGALDLLEAGFPGGSITGAPKIRAMEIIEELEIYRRGPYCGSIGYVSFGGEMDTSILIRTVTLNDKKAVFQAGGGIVADSDPESEYEETLVKARKLFQAFDDQFEPEQVRRP